MHSAQTGVAWKPCKKFLKLPWHLQQRDVGVVCQFATREGQNDFRCPRPLHCYYYWYVTCWKIGNIAARISTWRTYNKWLQNGWDKYSAVMPVDSIWNIHSRSERLSISLTYLIWPIYVNMSTNFLLFGSDRHIQINGFITNDLVRHSISSLLSGTKSFKKSAWRLYWSPVLPYPLHLLNETAEWLKKKWCMERWRLYISRSIVPYLMSFSHSFWLRRISAMIQTKPVYYTGDSSAKRQSLCFF